MHLIEYNCILPYLRFFVSYICVLKFINNLLMTQICNSLEIENFFNSCHSSARKLVILLVTALAFISCENTERPSRAMQANLNGDLFRAYSVEAFADINTQMIRIEATSDSEKFILYTQWKGANVYKIGGNALNYATFENALGGQFTTLSQGSFGTITISDFDTERQEFSGEFNFTFVSGTDTIVVDQGIFYSVPYMIVDGFTD